MMGGGMFDFSHTVKTGTIGQVDDGDPGDLMGLPWFLNDPFEGSIDFKAVSSDPLKKIPGDILGEQIFRI